LSAQRESLRRRGVHYLESDDQAQMGHQNFAKSFIKNPPAYMEMPSGLEAARDAVRLELMSSTSSTALLSSENLTLADVSELADFFSRSLGSVRIRIIFFARSQDELAESQYNQMVKLALTAKSFADYVASELDELDFAALLAPWAAHFGRENIIARVFDASGNRVIEDFLSCLFTPGTDLGLRKEAPILNPSVGYLATELFRSLNRFQLPQQRALYDRLNKVMQAFDLPPIYFNSSEARVFREQFRNSNEVFLSDYLGRNGSDLAGRKYSDVERDTIYQQIQTLKKAGETRSVP
jgi:hypothetical protein